MFDGDGQYDVGQSDDAFIDQNILENDHADYLDGTALLTESFSGTFDNDILNDNIEIMDTP